MARLRLAACLLADIAWAAHPDFRAERGIDMALHGNWVAIDAPGRVMLAQALFCNFGGGRELPYPDDRRACARPRSWSAPRAWGLRCGSASGSAAASPPASSAAGSRVATATRCASSSSRQDAALLGETVERRLKTLAAALGLRPEISLRVEAGELSRSRSARPGPARRDGCSAGPR